MFQGVITTHRALCAIATCSAVAGLGYAGIDPLDVVAARSDTNVLGEGSASASRTNSTAIDEYRLTTATLTTSNSDGMAEAMSQISSLAFINDPFAPTGATLFVFLGAFTQSEACDGGTAGGTVCANFGSITSVVASAQADATDANMSFTSGAATQFLDSGTPRTAGSLVSPLGERYAFAVSTVIGQIAVSNIETPEGGLLSNSAAKTFSSSFEVGDADSSQGNATLLISDTPFIFGACEFPFADGTSCIEPVPAAFCDDIGGNYLGDGSSCTAATTNYAMRVGAKGDESTSISTGRRSPSSADLQAGLPGEGFAFVCPDPIGACLFPSESSNCDVLTNAECAGIGGVYVGDGVPCADCNINDVPDTTEITDDPSLDCNLNAVLDACELASQYDPSPEANTNGGDLCEDCPLIGPGIFTGSTDFATASAMPLSCPPWVGLFDVFYGYIPRTSGTAAVYAGGFPLNMPVPDHVMVSIHTDCPPTMENQIACQDDNLQPVLFQVTAGQKYIIRVARTNALRGDFEMQLWGPDPLLNTNDLNANGELDECECIADITGLLGTPDGQVNQLDFIRVVRAVGDMCVGCVEDLNNDGEVTQEDVQIVFDNFGPCP